MLFPLWDDHFISIVNDETWFSACQMLVKHWVNKNLVVHYVKGMIKVLGLCKDNSYTFPQYLLLMMMHGHSHHYVFVSFWCHCDTIAPYAWISKALMSQMSWCFHWVKSPEVLINFILGWVCSLKLNTNLAVSLEVV